LDERLPTMSNIIDTSNISNGILIDNSRQDISSTISVSQVDSSASVYISQTSYRFCIEVSFVSAVLLQMRLPWSCQYHLVYCSMKIYLAPFLLDILCSWTCDQPTSTSTVIESWVRSLNSSIMLMKKLIYFFFFFEEN